MTRILKRNHIIMKALSISLFALLPVISSQGSTTINQTWSVSTAIPDNDDIGFGNTQSISAAGITAIESVSVDLAFTGGWNGDLYVYLVHNGAISVLLNRPGRSLTNPDGAASSGMTINLSDVAATDIHAAIPMNGGSVTGSFQPDGRTTDPLAVLATDARPAMLSSFTGLDANGSWTLFLADQASGEVSTLQSWSLSITGVPEPSAALLSALAVIGIAFTRRRGI